jgi:hypothetical protein
MSIVSVLASGIHALALPREPSALPVSVNRIDRNPLCLALVVTNRCLKAKSIRRLPRTSRICPTQLLTHHQHVAFAFKNIFRLVLAQDVRTPRVLIHDHKARNDVMPF